MSDFIDFSRALTAIGVCADYQQKDADDHPNFPLELFNMSGAGLPC
jgi:hypothetical protein